MLVLAIFRKALGLCKVRPSAPVVVLVFLVCTGETNPAAAQAAPDQGQPPPAAAQAVPDQGQPPPGGAQIVVPGQGPAAPPAVNAGPPEPGAAPQRTWYLQPRITVGETFTDNVNPGAGSKQADQITEITPGIKLQADTARLKAYADLQASDYYYAQGSYGSRTQIGLNSFGTFEALEKRLFLDFTGTITQASISAFGPQVASNAIIDANRTQISNYRLSPYYRGRLGTDADFEVRYGKSWVFTDTGLASNSVSQDWSAKVKNSIAKTRFGWTLEAGQQTVTYAGSPSSVSAHARVLLSYQIAPDFKLSASGGEESNNYITGSRVSEGTNGYGIDWTPTERTLVSLFNEKRFFGEGHVYTVSHRTPLMAFKFTDTRDVMVLPGQLGTVGLGSIYDLYYAQLASAIPDPTLRAQAVNALLAQTGISPNAQATSGFLTSQVSVQERQNLSTVYNGLRNTATITITRTVQSALGSAVGGGDYSVATSVTQKGVSASWSLRMTPLASLTTIVSQQQSSGGGLSSLQKTLNVSFTTRLGAHTNISLGARTGTFSSAALSYSENAVLGTLTSKF
jgi:uncharacterized protein (PEP-CTERM system associated)